MSPTHHPTGPSQGGATGPGDLPHAAALLAAMDHGRDPDAETVAGIQDVAAGLALQDQINRLRLARGEKPVGFKIGFTNRTIWDLYGVYAPIWAPVWDTTLVSVATDAPDVAAGAPTSAREASNGFDAGAIALRLNRPRLEPEIVFGLATIPPSAEPGAVAAAIAWVAHGFELVQSPWPDWKFHAGQAVASQSLHGALLLGPRRRVREPLRLAAALSQLAIELRCDGQLVATGRGSDVLDGPVQALGHWLAEIRRTSFEPVVQPGAGMVVTTGTLTDAQPIVPGSRWQSHLIDRGDALAQCLEGPLVDLDIRFGDKPSGGQ